MKRRTFLATTAAASGGVGLVLLSKGCARHAGPEALVVQTAEQLALEPGVRLLGHAYLDQTPRENQRDTLLAAIVGSLPSPEPAATGDDVIVLLLNQFGREFEQDHTVRVDGWLLSYTEARLYALAVSIRDS